MCIDYNEVYTTELFLKNPIISIAVSQCPRHGQYVTKKKKKQCGPITAQLNELTR